MIEKELVAASTEPLILTLLAKGRKLRLRTDSGSEAPFRRQDPMDRRHALPRVASHGGKRLDQIALGRERDGRRRKYYSLKKDGHQVLKEKREQWDVISSVLNGLWKGQHV
jgi:hypothetical protein